MAPEAWEFTSCQGGIPVASLGPIDESGVDVSFLTEASHRGLDRLRWKGGASYQVLSYPFTIRWNWSHADAVVRPILEPFAVAAQGMRSWTAATYSLLKPTGRAPHYRLYCGARLAISNLQFEDVLSYLLWHVYSQAMERTEDVLLIHSAAVATPAGVGLLLPGASGSGKTTLAAALIRAGFSYLSDEAAVIEPGTGRVLPFPRAMTLKKGSFEHFGELTENGDRFRRSAFEWYVRPEDLRAGLSSGPVPAGFVVAPAHRKGSPTVMTPISRAQAVMELGRNAINLSLYGGRALGLLRAVVANARCFRLVSGDVPSAVEAIVGATGMSMGPADSGDALVLPTTLESVEPYEN